MHPLSALLSGKIRFLFVFQVFLARGEEKYTLVSKPLTFPPCENKSDRLFLNLRFVINDQITYSNTCWFSFPPYQYPEDLLYNQTDSSRLTDIVDVKLYNPTTFREVAVGSLAEPVTFLIPLQPGKVFPNESTNSAEVSLNRVTGNSPGDRAILNASWKEIQEFLRCGIGVENWRLTFNHSDALTNHG